MKRASVDKKKPVIDILSEAFNDNLSVNYVVKQDSQRESRIRGLMDYSFNICNAFGEIWLSDDEQACALILFPDKKRTNLNSIIWDIRLALSVIGVNRISKVLQRESKIKKFHPQKPFTYLWFIGVRSALQNKGKGSDLLNEIIQQSQQKKRSIYLETSVERNLIWYKSKGFETYQQLESTYKLFLLRKEYNQER
jgi:ribosomal protein S18 acetylase RimI-like enzyme